MKKVNYFLGVAILATVLLTFSCTKKIAVESVTLDKNTLECVVGVKVILKATVLPDNADNKTVTWISSNPSVASVDKNGEVTALKAGTTTITAKAGKQNATCLVTVYAMGVAVTSVTLDKNTLALAVGTNFTLTATVLPTNATNKTVDWSSSAPSVASVSDNGKVTALAIGTTTIMAEAGSEMATCVVKVVSTDVYNAGVIINDIIWAKCNVDAPGTFAATPEAPGMFYQWNRKKGWPATGTVTGWDSSGSTGTTWEPENDPCPVNWRVPTKEELADLTNSGIGWTDTPAGCTFGSGSLFLPAAGYRSYYNGSLGNVGTHGYYWGSSVNGMYAYNLIFSSSTVKPGYNTYSGNGCSVRCVAK